MRQEIKDYFFDNLLYPSVFQYLKIRVSDEESAELLKHWDITFKFIDQAK